MYVPLKKKKLLCLSYYKLVLYSQSTTNKVQRFTISLFLQDALHVSDGFSVHRQELKTAHTASDI